MGEVRVTAVAGLHHQVPEHTYVLEAAGFRVYFGGDSLVIGAHHELRERFGGFDLALLPCNGLRIRIELNREVAASAAAAAELCRSLRPRYAVPIHYAFRGNVLTERLVIKHSLTGATDLQLAARHAAPRTEVRILAPGEPFVIEPALSGAAEPGSPAALGASSPGSAIRTKVCTAST
jgi:L-ascorbate metabolism protein UlaG (beta-lactamase superfamily)